MNGIKPLLITGGMFFIHRSKSRKYSSSKIPAITNSVADISATHISFFPFSLKKGVL